MCVCLCVCVCVCVHRCSGLTELAQDCSGSRVTADGLWGGGGDWYREEGEG